MLIWGLESCSSRLLDVLDKGIDSDLMADVLTWSAAAEIHNRVCVIYGIPGETDEEFSETLSFLEERREVIHSLAYSIFTFERHTQLMESGPHHRSLDDSECWPKLAVGHPASDEGRDLSHAAKNDLLCRIRSRLMAHHMRIMPRNSQG